MELSNMDPGLLAEFKQFLAFRAIQRDDTVKGTLDLFNPVDSAKDQTLTPLPPLPDRETSSSKPNNNGFPKKRLELKTHTPGKFDAYIQSSPNSEKQPESVLERSTTPRAFARRDKQARQNRLLSPTPPPIPTPSPDATPAPSNSRKRGCSPSPVSGPSKRAKPTTTTATHRPTHTTLAKRLTKIDRGSVGVVYTRPAVNEANCHRIKKPKGYQPGRGNHDPIHVAIGLRDNYDFSSDIRLVRKAAIKFRPRNLTLKPGQKLTLKHYGPSTKKKINDYAGKNKKAKLYLKRNESGGQDDQDGRDKEDNGDRDDYQDVEDKNDPDTNKAAYQDNYILNACYANKDEDDEDNEDNEDNKDEEPDLPPEPTPAQRRRADKVVAQETARNKTFSNSKGKAGAKPTAASKPAKGNSDKDESQDEDDKQPTRTVTKRVTKRPVIESSPKPEPTTNKKSTVLQVNAREHKVNRKGKRKQLSPTVDTDEDAKKEELEPPRRRRPPVKVRQTQQDDHKDEELPPLPPCITHNSSSAKVSYPLDGEPQVGPSKSAIEAVHTTQIDSEQLVNTGKAKAVGVIKIKRPPQHSSHELRPRT
ncbi:hypothetical protein RHS01_10235 [Rhizoctonia solani]|uniref:Uncharacterized protein n=1 Tax=Rhizoctonia solani TaxID=456999 RepID=A0A8H7I5U7_9AGAM|nr:hypothetical protein RHS01_10235 [Rhizoctonia solani]